MQRKQQVGECWVGVIFFACVWGGHGSDLMTTSDDPITYRSLWACALGTFLRGGPRGGSGLAPLGYMKHSSRATPNLFLGSFSILAFFFCYF
jgi:hypothetical protein